MQSTSCKKFSHSQRLAHEKLTCSLSMAIQAYQRQENVNALSVKSFCAKFQVDMLKLKTNMDNQVKKYFFILPNPREITFLCLCNIQNGVSTLAL